MPSCEHLEALTAADFPPPRTPGACEECTADGTVWVALRECRTCGHVGCCDDSPHRHAAAHFRATQHPVMRTVAGAFTWCYVHEVAGTLSPPKASSPT
jgi:monovalent cation/hydrogen antiporter